MSNLNEGTSDPRSELLAGLALGDLTPEERAELGSVSNAADQKTIGELELTIAALDLAMTKKSQAELPSDLRDRILAQGKHIIASRSSAAREQSAASPSRPHDYRGLDPDSLVPRRSRLSAREILAWCSCAAAILIAIGIWRYNLPVKDSSLTLAQARAKLLSEAIDVIRVAWVDGKTPLPGNVTGDVVWSNQLQSGFMRFSNLPVNDPTKEQYQLWIIDPERDDEPIDGGVFDISASGETIVAIQAKLKVLKPAAFAITIEKPGGVVVSKQERLPLLAEVKSG
jgi:hypothetical protein